MVHLHNLADRLLARETLGVVHSCIECPGIANTRRNRKRHRYSSQFGGGLWVTPRGHVVVAPKPTAYPNAGRARCGEAMSQLGSCWHDIKDNITIATLALFFRLHHVRYFGKYYCGLFAFGLYGCCEFYLSFWSSCRFLLYIYLHKPRARYIVYPNSIPGKTPS